MSSSKTHGGDPPSRLRTGLSQVLLAARACQSLSTISRNGRGLKAQEPKPIQPGKSPSALMVSRNGHERRVEMLDAPAGLDVSEN